MEVFCYYFDGRATYLPTYLLSYHLVIPRVAIRYLDETFAGEDANLPITSETN